MASQGFCRVANFSIGQVVNHRLCGYRGLVYDVDPFYDYAHRGEAADFPASPPKDSPWYHVLVDGADHVTYVAERNLVASREDCSQIDHPLTPEFFSRAGGGYQPRMPFN